MRILILGAGAIGGYFGARLLEAKCDVTFVVRPVRQQVLREAGLIVKSPRGDVTIHNPPVVGPQEIRAFYDLVLLCCKAYDLKSAIESIRPIIGPETVILPLLNGMQHVAILVREFGPRHILGGQCSIATQLRSDGTIIQLNERQNFSFGELGGRPTRRILTIARELGVVNVEARVSESIILEMWEKWTMIATLAGITCLMRASIGDILNSPMGRDCISALFQECCLIAELEGSPPRPAFMESALTSLLSAGSTLTASMFRDIESHKPVEADHILGDLVQRRRLCGLQRSSCSLLDIAFCHVKAYELRMVRESALADHPPG